MTLAVVLIRHDVGCITAKNTQFVIRHVVPARTCSSVALTVCCGKAHNLDLFQRVWDNLSSNPCHGPEESLKSCMIYWSKMVS
jgi:hypothetical protein